MEFEVGDEVVLRSKDCPSLSGFYKVREVVGFSYRLGVIGPNGFDLWSGNSLHLLHRPNTDLREVRYALYDR